jgi:hypothetical protein
LPPYSGGLRRCHEPHGSRPRLPARDSSGATTCPVASEPASLLRRAPILPCVTWLQTPPPSSRGLRCCHVPRGSGPRLTAQEGSGTATCPAAMDPASLLGRALVLPHVPQLQTPPPCSGGSGAATCPAAPDPASHLGRALVLPRATWLWTVHPSREGFGDAPRPVVPYGLSK